MHLEIRKVLFILFLELMHSFKPSQEYAVHPARMLRDKANHEPEIFRRFAS